MKYEILHIFFPASSPGENLELASVIPNPTNQDHDAVESLGKIAPDCEAKNLTIKISSCLIQYLSGLHVSGRGVADPVRFSKKILVPKISYATL